MVRAQYRAHLHNNQDLFQSFENQFAQIEKNISGKPDLYFKMRKIGLNGNKDHFWHFHVQIRITDGRQNLQALRAEKMPQSFSDISMLEYLEVSCSFRQLLDSAANLMEKMTPARQTSNAPSNSSSKRPRPESSRFARKSQKLWCTTTNLNVKQKNLRFFKAALKI